ncbi:Imm1 family immunity protein [Amycolatopsis sp. NBC_01480]|uniref:Imm1 family immunity protein n=1 Tax=Amycolatopsis sp. NBC_01480 TaxID=2903562 RepID=UPI002E28EDF7|nr:Imm1 family immunity protein [Amycolatopsis sp. NBC_01480]
MQESTQLIDEILKTDHVDWETTLMVGDVEFHHGKSGPFPDQQFRISVSPPTGFAALNYMNNRDPDMPITNSFNSRRPLPDVNLIFNGSTGAVFPRTAAIPILDARAALIEWLETRQRPTCIEWRPYDAY